MQSKDYAIEFHPSLLVNTWKTRLFLILVMTTVLKVQHAQVGSTWNHKKFLLSCHNLHIHHKLVHSLSVNVGCEKIIRTSVFTKLVCYMQKPIISRSVAVWLFRRAFEIILLSLEKMLRISFWVFIKVLSEADVKKYMYYFIRNLNKNCYDQFSLEWELWEVKGSVKIYCREWMKK